MSSSSNCNTSHHLPLQNDFSNYNCSTPPLKSSIPVQSTVNIQNNVYVITPDYTFYDVYMKSNFPRIWLPKTNYKDFIGHGDTSPKLFNYRVFQNTIIGNQLSDVNMEEFFVNLFFQYRFFDKKVIKNLHIFNSDLLLDAWQKFVKDYLNDSISWLKNFENIRVQFEKSNPDGMRMVIHRLCDQENIPCAVREIYKCPLCLPTSRKLLSNNARIGVVKNMVSDKLFLYIERLESKENRQKNTKPRIAVPLPSNLSSSDERYSVTHGDESEDSELAYYHYRSQMYNQSERSPKRFRIEHIRDITKQFAMNEVQLHFIKKISDLKENHSKEVSGLKDQIYKLKDDHNKEICKLKDENSKLKHEMYEKIHKLEMESLHKDIELAKYIKHDN